MNTLPTLYELAAQYRDMAATLVDLDLPDQVIADSLEGESGDLTTKATNVAFVVRNLESLAEQITIAEIAMALRRKSIENRAENIRRYLKASMELAGITKIECPYFRLSIRQNPVSVMIEDEAAIPPEFMVQPPMPAARPDKKAIKSAIEGGVIIPGVALARTSRVEIK